MSNRRIVHEIKLENSVKLILAVIAVGLIANPFIQMFGAKDALSDISRLRGKIEVELSGKLNTY